MEVGRVIMDEKSKFVELNILYGRLFYNEKVSLVVRRFLFM